jgi:IS5 family transposase
VKQTDLSLNLTTKRTCKHEFLAQMERGCHVRRWSSWSRFMPSKARRAAGEAMLRIHFVQQWFTLSDSAMGEALHEVPLLREFAGLGWDSRLPDENTILQFRHLLERNKLAEQILALVNDLPIDKSPLRKAGTVLDAMLIAVPSSTKNKDGQRNSEMHQGKKGNQWFFGMKAPIGVDGDSGLIHTVRATSSNVNCVVKADSLLHGQERIVFSDARLPGCGQAIRSH